MIPFFLLLLLLLTLPGCTGDIAGLTPVLAPPLNLDPKMIPFFLLLLLLLTLPGCTGDIAGLTPAQRDSLYTTAAVLSGRPQLVPVIYGARRAVTSAKQPREVTP